MTIAAKILADSVALNGSRIVTFELTYPRIVHAEFLTHRMFSRSSASSRAIPFSRMLRRIQEDPFVPMNWGTNKPGMQAGAELIGEDAFDARQTWLSALEDAVHHAEELNRLGLHKQITNRLLEPWMHITVIATATERTNFYALRYHADAEPHFQGLAKAMWEAEQTSIPRYLHQGEWHLPLVAWNDEIAHDPQTLLKLSVARCARASYLNHDGTHPDVEKDIALYDKLLAAGHMSPFEHQATPAHGAHVVSGNLIGWEQHRKFLPEENRTTFVPPA